MNLQILYLRNFPLPFPFCCLDSTHCLYQLCLRYLLLIGVNIKSVYNEKYRDLYARSLSESTEWKLN